MNTTVYIVGDDPPAIETLATYVRRTPGLQLRGTAGSPQAPLEQLRQGPPPDLAFLDIDLPGISGLELAPLLPGPTRVIISTSYREFGPEAFEHNVLDYLLKPFGYERFLAAIHKFDAQRPAAASLPETGNPQSLLVKTGTKGQLLKIDPPAILYIEGAQNYVKLHLDDHSTVMTYLSLREVQQHLPANSFLRVHKSFIVNLDRIHAIRQGRIFLDDQQQVPIGRAFQEAVGRRLGPLIAAAKK